MTSHGTNNLPTALEDKLIEAKVWHDKCQKMIDANFTDATAWADSAAKGCQLLAEIVQITEDEWGFA